MYLYNYELTVETIIVEGRYRKSLIIFCIIGPIYYFLLLWILGVLWEGYDPIFQSMSEIGAVDSPYRHYMNFFGFSFIGVCILSFAILYKFEFNHSISQQISFYSLIIAGIFMVAVGFLPCDAGCIDVTTIGKLHSITSTIPAIFLPLAAIFSGQVTTFQPNWGKKWGYISFYLGLLSMASGPIMFISAIENYLGLIQRLGIGISLLWIFLMLK